MSVDFHFLNAGYGDCTIVHWPERTRGDKSIEERIMMVDIYHHNDHEDYENVIDYYKKHFKGSGGSLKPIFRFVCSHPHQDHICGLAKLFKDSGIEILNFWDLEHSFVPEDFDGHPTHEEDWKTYKGLGSSSAAPKALQPTRETSPGEYWNEDGDRITILSPCAELAKYAHYKEDGSRKDPVEIDEMSYALSVRVNNRSVVLAGDGRATPTWQNIYDNCSDTLKNCYVLKAGHHGQESSFHEDAVKLMSPVLIVLSNSEEQNKANGAEDEYKRVCPNVKIYRTWEGTVVVRVPFEADKPIGVSQG